MNRGLRIAVLLALIFLVSTSVSHAQPKPPTRARAAATSQQTVPAPHWGSAKTLSPVPIPSPKTATGPKTTTPKAAVCTHTVRSGESISRIAARYRVTRAALIEANRLANPHALRSGQHLSVPGCQPSVPQTTAGETPGTEPDADGILNLVLACVVALHVAEDDAGVAGDPPQVPLEAAAGVGCHSFPS